MAVKSSSDAEARAKAASEDLSRQIEVLREEIARLAGELRKSGQRSAAAAGNVAADGVEALRAQGEVAMEALRESASDLERELARNVREKPVTTLAIAAGIGFLLGLAMQR